MQDIFREEQLIDRWGKQTLQVVARQTPKCLTMRCIMLWLLKVTAWASSSVRLTSH